MRNWEFCHSPTTFCPKVIIVDEKVIAAHHRVEKVYEKEIGGEYEISLENAFQARYESGGIIHCEREKHIGSMKYEESPSRHMPHRVDADWIEEGCIRKQADIKDGLI